MKALFICRASTKDGFGHLFRSRALINDAPGDIDAYLAVLASGNDIVPGPEKELRPIKKDDELLALAREIQPTVIFFDLNEFDGTVFDRLNDCFFTVCLSPLFDHRSKVNQVFHRTIYFDQKISGPEIHAGLDYSVLSGNCRRIPESFYREHLQEDRLSIAISMGGGDAANKTLEILEALAKFDGAALFWILVGEGYPHSYDELVRKTHFGKAHEVVLARTNHSMWRVLRNCQLAVLAGGVTSHDAVYAGLPAINLLHSPERYFLIKELVEKEACFYPGSFNSETLSNIPRLIEKISLNKGELLKMHNRAKKLIDGRGSLRIWQKTTEKLALCSESVAVE